MFFIHNITPLLDLYKEALMSISYQWIKLNVTLKQEPWYKNPDTRTLKQEPWYKNPDTRTLIQEPFHTQCS